MIWKESGGLLDGWFENDKRIGLGRFMNIDGNSGEGEFFNDMRNGHGNNIHSYIHYL